MFLPYTTLVKQFDLRRHVVSLKLRVRHQNVNLIIQTDPVYGNLEERVVASKI